MLGGISSGIDCYSNTQKMKESSSPQFVFISLTMTTSKESDKVYYNEMQNCRKTRLRNSFSCITTNV